jgi:hypothetical protein
MIEMIVLCENCGHDHQKEKRQDDLADDLKV